MFRDKEIKMLNKKVNGLKREFENRERNLRMRDLVATHNSDNPINVDDE